MDSDKLYCPETCEQQPYHCSWKVMPDICRDPEKSSNLPFCPYFIPTKKVERAQTTCPKPKCSWNREMANGVPMCEYLEHGTTCHPQTMQVDQPIPESARMTDEEIVAKEEEFDKELCVSKVPKGAIAEGFYKFLVDAATTKCWPIAFAAGRLGMFDADTVNKVIVPKEFKAGEQKGRQEVVTMGIPLTSGYHAWLKAGGEIRRQWLEEREDGHIVFIPNSKLKEWGLK